MSMLSAPPPPTTGEVTTAVPPDTDQVADCIRGGA